MVVLLSDNHYVIPISAQRLNTNVRGESRSKERDFEQQERQQQRFDEKEARRKRRFQQFEEKKAHHFESFSSSHGTKNRDNFDSRFHRKQEEETNEYSETINAFYDAYKSIASNSQNSRHILQGAGKAFTSALFGLFSGFPFLLGFPIALSKTEALRGWPGVIFGLILGALSSAITTAIGVFNGARQLLIGAWNTPSAISAYFFQGKIWDMKENEWKTYVLDDEAEELLDPANTFKNDVSDSTYYNLLNINPGSTFKEVKRAYYTKARDLHPDKNPDDDEAARQFIQIHEAYQTLIDPSKRADYDNLGRRASSSSSSDFNVGVFFEILFSSQPVEKYVGQLGVASFFGHWIKLIQSSSGSDSSPTMDTFISWLKAFETQTLQRYVQVAVHLRDFISPLATKAVTKNEFLAMCQKEAETIAENSFGETFLVHIGSALVQEANLFLSQSWYGWPVWMFSALRKKANNLQGKIRGFKMVTKVVSDVTGLFNSTDVLDRIRGESDNKLILNTSQIEEILPNILEIAWAYNAYDITKLLGKSCEKVFFDSKVPYGERRRRARALRLLGETFVQRGEAKSSTGEQCSTESGTCKNPKSNAQDMKIRAEVAFRMAQQNSRQKSSESEEMIKKAQKKRSA